MSSFENISLVKEGNIAIITINRPEKLNALSLATLDELKTLFQEIYDDKEVGGVIITGEGPKAFVAGADIGEFTELNDLNARKFSENGQEIFELIENFHAPVVAAVNGYALGGGCELAMACHMRVASANARFGQPEVDLGIIPGYGGTQRMTQLIGKGKSLELMMTGEMIGAEEALQLGLVNYVTATQEEMMAKSLELLNKISKKAPLAIGLIIKSVNAVYNPNEDGYQTEANAFARCCGSNDFKEGVKAFIEKRTPEFQGE